MQQQPSNVVITEHSVAVQDLSAADQARVMLLLLDFI
jgi:hypothetical protein